MLAKVRAFTMVAALVASGCVSVDYVGKSFPPTSNVELYMSAADVGRPYEVIGQVRAETPTLPFVNSAQPLQEKLLAEARSRGADGIILGQLANRVTGSVANTTGQGKIKKGKNVNYNETTTTTDEEVTELRGTLIRYK